jgi:hypothetical protein
MSAAHELLAAIGDYINEHGRKQYLHCARFSANVGVYFVRCAGCTFCLISLNPSGVMVRRGDLRADPIPYDDPQLCERVLAEVRLLWRRRPHRRKNARKKQR